MTDFLWISILLPFITGLFCFKRFDTSLKLFYLYVLYGTVNEVVTFILRRFGLDNTMPFIHLYQIVTFPILVLFYSNLIYKKTLTRFSIVLISIFELFNLINLVFIQSIYEYPNFTRTIATFVVIVLCIWYFYRVMVEAKIMSLWDEPLIWINGALLIYYSGNLFFTVLFNLILEYSREFSKITVVSFSVILTLFYVLVTIGFSKAGGKMIKTSGRIV